jgi:hypothetical protein
MSWRRAWASVILHFTFCILPWLAWAYPPAPDAIIYGMVKDQNGMPLTDPTDQVILQNAAGAQVVGAVQPGLAIGINYVVHVPMDAGTLGTLYAPNAQVVGNQYKLYVSVNTTTNLPIEMSGSWSILGASASQTRQNLTLGTDANGDGIPDAWEQAFLASIGVNIPLASINPNADYAHDGRTLQQEYLLGDYPFNPGYNFAVTLVSQNAGSAVLAFTTMTGRSYTVSGSADLQNWTPLAFTIPALGTSPSTAYYAPSIQPLQIQTLQPTNSPTVQFFRLQLQ